MDLDKSQLASLVQISSILNATQDTRRLLPLILLKARELLASEAGSLFLLDPEENFLYCETAISHGGEVLQDYLRLEVGQGIAGWVAQHRRPVLIEDAYADPRFNAQWDRESGFRTKSILCVPLFLNTDLVGTLQVLNKQGGGVFTKRDQEMLTLLSDTVAVAVHNARLHDGLRKRILELTLLYEFEKQIVSGANIEELGRWLLDRCLEVMESRSGSLLIWEREEEALRVLAARGIPEDMAPGLRIRAGEGISGWVAEHRKPLLVRDIESDERFRKENVARYETRSLVSAPILSQGELLGVLNINNKASGYAFNESDLHMIVTAATRLGSAIRNIQMANQMSRTAEEVSRARMLMDMVVPKEHPRIAGLVVASRYILVERIGGDFYKFVPLGPRKVGVLVADVCGHGLSAAMVALMAHSVISTFDQKLLDAPGEMFASLNQILYRLLGGSFLTAFYAVIDLDGRSLRYANAGHRNPVLYQRGRRRSLTLKSKGTIIGTFPDRLYEERGIEFHEGDRLVVYTDGLLERMTGRQMAFVDEAQLADMTAGGAELGAEQLAQKILEDVRRNLGGGRFDDDATLLVLDALPHP